MIYLKLIRYKNLIIIVLLQVLLRYGLILPILAFHQIKPALSFVTFCLMVLSTVLLAASGYVINDYFDLRTDRINRPDSVIIGRRVLRRFALLLHVLLSFAGVFIGLFLAYITRKESYVIMYIFIPAILWAYSTTFKKQVLIGNFMIAFLTAIVPYIVVSLEFAMLSRTHGQQIIDTEACSAAWFWTNGFAFFAFITTLTREIIKDMEDVKGDKAIGCRTLPIEIGIPYAKLIVNLLAACSVIAIWFIYFVIESVKQIPFVYIYLLAFLTIPYLYLMFVISRAKEPKDFHRASTTGKWIILFGILFILLSGYNMT